jgi:hypothetical protein
MPIDMHPVKSSQISSVGHDGESTMIVNFVNGSIYEYKDVPFSYYETLISAESVGSFFSKTKKQLTNYRKM